jgi:hypothetical protein
MEAQQTRQIWWVIAALLAFAALAGAVIALQDRRPSTPGDTGNVSIDAPAVRVDADKETGNTTIEAPHTRIERDADGTRIQAPGVDINVPNRANE